MNDREGSRRTPRRIPRLLAAGLLVLTVGGAAGAGYMALAGPTAASPIHAPRDGEPGLPAGAPRVRAEHAGLRGERRALRSGEPGPARTGAPALGRADGVLPPGTTVSDTELPGIADLDAELLRALQQAATDARRGGVELYIESGWRSPRYQGQLRREAVSKYGSDSEAARWVATVETSAHTSGDAVDIAPPEAAVWLSERGTDYGLCQIYRNEPWH